MKSNFISLIIGLIFLGIGSVITVFEFAEYEFINEVHYNDSFIKKGEKSIALNNSSCIKVNLDDINHYSKYNVIYDESIGDNIVIRYYYLDGVYNVNFDDKSTFNGCKRIEVNYSTYRFGNIKGFLEEIMKDLRNKKIYNYAKTAFRDIDIVINPIYKDKLEIR